MEYLPESSSNPGYVNESERNVHVWCSLVMPCRDTQYKDWPTLGLIAGCWVRPNEVVPILVFYRWLDMIILRRNDSEYRSLLLFPCFDPRLNKPLRLGPLPFPQRVDPLPRDSESALLEGHYLLCQSVGNRIHPIWPPLVDNEFGRRSTTRTQSCTPSPSKPARDTTTIRQVRKRDGACIATGQEALARPRGANFTGLQVAHIFPLGGVGLLEWLSGMTAATRSLVQTSKLADRPLNAILLRADIHALFDDYQWSVWIESDGTQRMVRFEKSGAPFLDQYDSVVQWSPETLAATNGPNLDLATTCRCYDALNLRSLTYRVAI